ncbi:Tad domain-containing protein, partial [bacterium]|nr:Tad domain-containing protein [bacterium]
MPHGFNRNLLRGNDGQALIFGAMTLFMLAAFVIFISEMGIVTSGRIQVQNAADECAYSGALYEANVISAVAYLNEAMAYMYYDALRYAVDTTSLGVLSSLKQWGRPNHPPPSDKLVYDDKDGDAPEYSGNPIGHYDRAYDRARDNVPEIERTLSMFARWEWGMALSCAELVRMEINRVALKNGVEGLALYPDVDFFPDNGVQFDLHILKLMEGGEHVGWRVWSEDPDFFVEARKLGPFHWLITNTDRVTYEIERVGLNPDTYRIQTPDKDITVTIHEEGTHIGLVIIDTSGGETKETKVDARKLPGLGWAISAEDEDTRIDYEPMAGGGWKIKVTNKKTGHVDEIGVRMNNGRLQEWRGGAWVDVPGQHDSVTVGGKKIDVQVSDTIDLGNGTSFNPASNTLHVGGVTYHIPNVFNMGNIWVSLGNDSVRIDALIGINTRAGRKTLRFRIEEDSREMILYGLLGIQYRVPGSADCKWHANIDGSQRDRLCRDCQLLEGECTTPSDAETEWTYQYRMGHP